MLASTGSPETPSQGRTADRLALFLALALAFSRHGHVTATSQTMRLLKAAARRLSEPGIGAVQDRIDQRQQLRDADGFCQVLLYARLEGGLDLPGQRIGR